MKKTGITFMKNTLKKFPLIVKVYYFMLHLRQLAKNYIQHRNEVRVKYKASRSYSQCGEDLIANYIFDNYLRISKPTYLDIGAHHPMYLSNSFLFYQKGSYGVCVEPDPDLCTTIVQKRPKDVCINAGIGFSHDKTADFYIMNEKTLNTFSKSQVEYYESRTGYRVEKRVTIPLLSVNDLIKKYFDPCPNFVTIDVEGLDIEILRSFNFETYRPEVFCVETLTYAEDKTEHKIQNIMQLMDNADYFVYGDTYINTIFVDKKAWKNRP